MRHFEGRSMVPKSVSRRVLDNGSKLRLLVKPESSVCWWTPIATSQSRIVLSFDADASVWPSGEKATE